MVFFLSKPGTYHTTLVHHNKWKIYTKLEIINEDVILEHIEQAINQTEKVCNQFQQMEKEKECQFWKQEIERTTNTLKKRVEGLRIFLKTNRPKRALINAVGKLSKYLFGTMDADDAEEIEGKIKTLDTNNKKTLHLMEKQISITASNFKSIQSEIGNITEIQHEFEERLKIIEIQAEHFHDLVGNMMLNRLMIQVTSRIEKLQQYLDEQYEIITNLKLHLLHPLLLSADDLYTVYSEITNYEKEHHIAKDNQITSQLITVNTETIDDEIWIQISIPLIEPQTYTMYQAYEIPTTKEGITYALNLENTYLLNNTRTQNYIELSQKSVEKQCITCETKSGHEILACEIPQARIIGTPSTNCLINLFNKEEKEKRSCKHKVITDMDELLVKLHQENAWMYFFVNKQDIIVQCKDNLRRIQIQGAGVMMLTQDCRFAIDHYELPYVKNKNTTLAIHQVEKDDLPIPEINMNKWQSKVKSVNSGKLKLTQHSEFHQSMQKGLRDLEELEKEVSATENVSLPTKIQSHTNSISMALRTHSYDESASNSFNAVCIKFFLVDSAIVSLPQKCIPTRLLNVLV